jgi:hypothetical protein
MPGKVLRGISTFPARAEPETQLEFHALDFRVAASVDCAALIEATATKQYVEIARARQDSLACLTP